MIITIDELRPGDVFGNFVYGHMMYIDLVVAVRRIGPDLDGKPRMQLTRLYVNSNHEPSIEVSVCSLSCTFEMYNHVIALAEERQQEETQ